MPFTGANRIVELQEKFTTYSEIGEWQYTFLKGTKGLCRGLATGTGKDGRLFIGLEVTVSVQKKDKGGMMRTEVVFPAEYLIFIR